MLPYIALLAVLVLAAIGSGGLRSRPRLGASLGLAAVVLAGALWLWARPEASAPWPAVSFLGYYWTVTAGGWQLTGLVLLVALSALLSNWVREAQSNDRTAITDRTMGPLALSASLLPFLWAGDPFTAATTFFLFGLVWAFVLWRSGPISAVGASVWRLAGFLLAPLLLLWFADAIALSTTRGSVWIELAGAAVLIAAALLLGIWPFAGWRKAAKGDASGTALMLASLPVITGVTILLPVAGQRISSGLQLALAVIFGFLGLLMGLRSAGQLASLRNDGVAGLAGALSGLVLLTAVFTSESAMLVAVRVAVFVPLALTLIAEQYTLTDHGSHSTNHRLARWIHLGVVVIAGLAVLGMPLTAGFPAIMALYKAWQPGFLYVLVLVLIILLVAWSAVLSYTVLQLARRPSESDPVGQSGAGWINSLPLLIPLVALVYIDLPGLAGLGFMAWLALAVPLVAGPLIAWLLGDRIDVTGADAASILPSGHTAAVVSALHRGRAIAGDAFAEALGILEGPSGLLWVLIAVILLVLLT